MSTSTPYLGLVLYDSTTDQAVTFATFRAVWGGPAGTSNFYKIDTGMSGFNTRITNLENASGAVPVPALFISSNFYTATGVTGITAYNTGQLIVLSLDTTSNGTVTLDINSLGTKSVMKVDSTGTAINLTGSDLVDGRQYLFMYDGTRWTWVSANSADQIQIVGTSGNVVTVGSTNNLLGTTTQAGLIADTTHAATAKTTIADSDEIGLADSAASYILKRITWANIKATFKATSSQINTGTDDINYITSLGLRSSITGVLPDGFGINYQIVSSIATNNLTLAIKGEDGNDPSPTNPVIVRSGNSQITLSSALSVTITAAMGDIFGWDTGKVQANDAQVFVYFINNNGTAQLGVSPCPMLTTVATNYYDLGAGSQTGSAGYTNIVMSGTRNATNSCRNIARINVNQLDNNNWQSPTTASVTNSPTYFTNWMNWTPTLTGYSSAPTTPVYRYMINENTCTVTLRENGAGTSNATVKTYSLPVKVITLTNMTWIGTIAAPTDNSVLKSPGFLLAQSAGTILTAFLPAGVDWTASGSAYVGTGNMFYQVS